jgi:uncharacterized protein (UPF0332 family)
MPFDWKEYLDLAQFLATNQGSFTREAALRCAISRAYFAAFCHARNYASSQQGFKPKRTEEDHSDVREHFKRSGMLDIASKLDQLRQWRNKCDYAEEVFQVPVIAESALNTAQTVFSRLKAP